MFILFMDAKEFGFHSVPYVKAHYATYEEALAQAEHNLAQGKQRPVKIEDEDGNELWRASQVQ